MCVDPQQVYRAKLWDKCYCTLLEVVNPTATTPHRLCLSGSSKTLQKLSLFVELDMETSSIRGHKFFVDLNYQLKEDPPDHGGHNSSQMLLVCKELHWVQVHQIGAGQFQFQNHREFEVLT